VRPDFEPLYYREPTSAERARARDIRLTLQSAVPGGIRDFGEPRFSFIGPLSRVESGPGWKVTVPEQAPALQVAARRFETGKASGVHIRVELSNASGLGPEDFEILPESARSARIVAPTVQAVIRGLYALRNLNCWPTQRIVSKDVWPHRFLYSYFALYGDPLMDLKAAGLPDGYLDRAAASGMNGIWIQGILNTLAPSKDFPEFGKGWQIR
jgi:hypothetical protein